MNIKTIGVWMGDNFQQLISVIAETNLEITIKRQGKKLILKDKRVDFYSCISVGSEVEIPITSDIHEEDEPEEVCECCNHVISETQKVMMMQWGYYCRDCGIKKIHFPASNVLFCPACEK
jgi:hypothetical protein